MMNVKYLSMFYRPMSVLAGDEPGSDDVEARIAAAVAEATAGLKQNRDQILREKQELSEQLKKITQQIEALGGTDGIKKMAEMRERLEKDEMGKLLADGKYDEWFDKRTQAMRASFEAQIKALNEKLEAAVKEAETARTRLGDKVLETEVRAAASKAGLVETAVEDALFRARSVFKHQDDRLVILDESGNPVFGKDGKTPKSVADWLEEQKETARHWWPPSEGSGARGGQGGGGREPDARVIGSMDMNQYRKYRESQGLGQRTRGIPG